MHGVCQPIFNPVFCSSLALDMLFPHLRVGYLVVDVSGTDHFFVMDKTSDTSTATEAFQLRFRRFLGKSITEVCFSVTPL